MHRKVNRPLALCQSHSLPRTIITKPCTHLPPAAFLASQTTFPPPHRKGPSRPVIITLPSGKTCSHRPSATCGHQGPSSVRTKVPLFFLASRCSSREVGISHQCCRRRYHRLVHSRPSHDRQHLAVGEELPEQQSDKNIRQRSLVAIVPCTSGDLLPKKVVLEAHFFSAHGPSHACLRGRKRSRRRDRQRAHSRKWAHRGGWARSRSRTRA